MHTLLDTSILLRSIEVASSDRPVALAAVSALVQSGRALCISSQTIYEFLAVATKPVAENGLGLQHAQADAVLEKLLGGIDVFFDSEVIAKEARRLVSTYQVIGKKVHDARLVATMNVRSVQEILTFNGGDFSRYPKLTVLAPIDVAAGRLPPIVPPS